MSYLTQRIAGLALLGTLLTACSDAEAAGDTITREFHEATAALTNWSSMRAEEFDAATERAIQATDRRLEQLRAKVTNSEATRATIEELEALRESIGKHMSEVGNATKDKLDTARRTVVDELSNLGTRLDAAWQELAGK